MAVSPQYVGVLGATSLVGRLLLSQLVADGYEVRAFTRGDLDKESISGVEWRMLDVLSNKCQSEMVDVNISLWVCVAPIWCLSNYFSLLEAYGVRRIVALSSTSLLTKSDSSDLRERETARMMAEAERVLCAWAERNGVEWLILRPTLIYGFGRDKNVSVIARFIRRFGFFPLVGNAQGLRQPLHAVDVADVCRAVLGNTDVANRIYNIAGGETLTYREMVTRIFAALGRPARMLSVPAWMFRTAMSVLRMFPRYRHWTVSMAIRMNQDLVFDYGDATHDLSYNPRKFMLCEEDVLVEQSSSTMEEHGIGR